MYSRVNSVKLAVWLIVLVIPIYVVGAESVSHESFVSLPEGKWDIVRNVEMKVFYAEAVRHEQIKVSVEPDEKGTKMVFRIVESKVETKKGEPPFIEFEPYAFMVMKSQDGSISSIKIKEGKSKEEMMMGSQLGWARDLILLVMPDLSISSLPGDISEDKKEFKKFCPLRLKCSDVPDGVWTDIGGDMGRRPWPPPKEFFVTDILENGNIVFGASELNANLKHWLIWRYVYNPVEQRIVEGERVMYDLSGEVGHPLSVNKVFRGFLTGRLKIGGYNKTIVKISPAKEEPEAGEGEKE